MAQTAMFPRLQLAAIFLAIFSWIAPVQAQITVDWVRNYGTAGNNAGFDAVASDSSGNTYAAGHMRGATLAIGGTTLTRIGTRDAVVAKFDSTGSVIWAKNLGGAGASVFAFAVAVDGSGNVYVAGRLNQDLTTPSLTRIGSTDAFVIKLDSSGTTVWARNYGGSGATAEAYGLAVDSSGNVVAVGILQTGNLTTPSLTLIGSRDAFAIKLDSSGSVVWAQNFGGAGAAFDAKAVAADASGNVYLTGGIVAGNLTSPTLSRVGTGDAVVIKLASAGNVIWTQSLNGAGANAFATGIAVDDSQNVYVVGTLSSADLTQPSVTRIGSMVAFAVKLTSSGAFDWSRSFGGSGADASSSGVAYDGTAIHVLGSFQRANLTTPALTLVGSKGGFVVSLDTNGTTAASQAFGGAVGLGGITWSGIAATGGGIRIAALIDVDLTNPSVTKIGTTDAVLIKANDPGLPLEAVRSKSGSGSGTITSSPAGISCGATCSANFSSGLRVTLSAAAASGSTFTGWSGDCSGSSTAVLVVMTAARSCTATFDTTVGSGGGSPPPSWLGSGGSGELSFSNIEVTMGSDGSISAAIPPGNFNDGSLTFSALLSDGSSLPSWLIFDPVTLSFSGTPPAGDSALAARASVATPRSQSSSGRWLATPPLRVASRLNIALQVSDRQGRSVTIRFPLVINAPRTTATVVAASVSDAGVAGNGISTAPQLSDDGAVLVFQSAASNLFGADVNSFPDIVRYDVASGRLARFSTGSFMGSIAGPASGWSGSPAVSADASTIAFASDAANVGLPWGNGSRQVWAADATRARVSTQTPSPTAVSAAADGTLGNGGSDSPALSEDGRYVAFESEATNLAPGATSSLRRIYRKDRSTGAILLVGTGQRASITADGRYVAYDDGVHVHRADLAAGTTVTVGAGTVARLNRDGRYLVFQSGGSVKRVDMASAAVATVVAEGGSAVISGDGRFVSHVAGGQVWVRDMVAEAAALVSTTAAGNAGNGESSSPAISGDGRYVAFTSQATDLATGISAGQLYLAGNPLSPPLASGWWWNADAPGTGIAIETGGDRLMLGAFLYAADGSPIWYLASGTMSGERFSGNLVLYHGGQTLAGDHRPVTPIGAAGTAQLTATSRLIASLAGAHAANLSRFEFSSGGLSAGAQIGSPESGWWWNPEEPGTGWFLEIQNASLFVAGFLYDERGQASWVTASGPMASARSFSGTLVRCSGGQTLGGNVQSPLCSADQGTLSLAFTSPISGRLTLPAGREVTIKRFRF